MRAAWALALALLAGPAAAMAPPAPGSLRIAQFDAALSRAGAGVLLRDLLRGRDRQIAAVVEIIAAARPDILVLNGIDHDRDGRALAALAGLLAAAGLDLPHRFAGPVNAGEPSGVDLDGDGIAHGPDDAHGFGRFPGERGMAVLSRWPLGPVRSFRLMRWADLPGADLPRRADGSPFPSARAQAVMRLSSRAHWDVPVATPAGPLHLLVSHPTPPVFDDAHDLNGRRNADEIRFWSLYLSGVAMTDDAGIAAPRAPSPVVVAGVLNADPEDGEARHAAIRALLSHPALQDPRPASPGAAAAAGQGANRRHRGDPALDTADLDDARLGNLRLDYVLPDARLRVTGAGVFWPAPDDPQAGLLTAGGRPVSAHRLVWVDVALP
ncbi:MAG: endonuclease [Paracoccaceae bacterium]|nr:MAG: endonuclease [Paracoccaceae bacterium]